MASLFILFLLVRCIYLSNFCFLFAY